MALPAVVGLIGKIAAIPGVKEGAARLATDVYGRLMKRGAAEPAVHPAPVEITSDDAGRGIAMLRVRLDDMATRDELIASFATLQSELDRRHQRSFGLLGVVLLLQAVLLAILLLR